MKKFFCKAIFVFRFRYLNGIASMLRTFMFSLAGMRTGSGTRLPKIYITWPHQVQIGAHCKLEHNISLKFDGIYCPGPSIIIGDNNFIGNNCEFNIRQSIHIGNNNLIASGCRFVDHDHGLDTGSLMKDQPCVEAAIVIGDDVWIGANAVILKGVTIENGAVIAAGAVVKQSIPVNEIWAGIPAKKIATRDHHIPLQ
ncbi:MAG: acyltransferase [Bacteroidetes bacterium]|nr:acyltransferase [Bacteroidota bacterium]